MSITTAVIPAAGLATRFLPASKAVPKELMPLGDVPAIQLIVDEAVSVGVEHIVIVSHRNKPAIERYFEPAPALVQRLRDKGRERQADRLAAVGADYRVSIVYQDEPLGLGHAVGCARDVVDGDDFVVMLPDEVMGDASLLSQMVAAYKATGGSVVGVKKVPMAQVPNYGVIVPAGDTVDGVVPVNDLVEKPALADAPSDLIIIGRYVLTNDIFDLIAGLTPGSGGELQLTDALRAQARTGVFSAVVGTAPRYDTGNPVGFLEAAVALALANPAMADGVRGFLDTLDTRCG